MVRFLKLKHLEEKRRELVARSEIHRRMLQLELANVKYSAASLKQQLGFVRILRKVWRFAAPVAASFLTRRQAGRGKVAGFIGSVVSGIKMAGELLPLFKKPQNSSAHKHSPAERA